MYAQIMAGYRNEDEGMRTIDIGPKDLRGPVKERTGLAGVNNSVNGGTQAWSRLGRVGKSILFDRGLIHHEEVEEVEEDGKVVRGKVIFPYTGPLTFLVRQGGIKEQGLDRLNVQIFREDVYPAIRSFVKDCPNVFELELNYNDSRLLSGKVIFKGCPG